MNNGFGRFPLQREPNVGICRLEFDCYSKCGRDLFFSWESTFFGDVINDWMLKYVIRVWMYIDPIDSI